MANEAESLIIEICLFSFLLKPKASYVCINKEKRNTHLSLDQFSNFTILTQIPGESLSKQGLTPSNRGLVLSAG